MNQENGAYSDTYFMSLAKIARAYNLLNSQKKRTLAHKSPLEISPLGIDASALVRTLEDQSKVFWGLHQKYPDVAIAIAWPYGVEKLGPLWAALSNGSNYRRQCCPTCKRRKQPSQDASVKKDTPQEVFSFLKYIVHLWQKAVFIRQLLLAALLMARWHFILLAKTCSRTALKLPLMMQPRSEDALLEAAAHESYLIALNAG